MSGPWPRNQTLSFKPGGTGSGAAGSLNSTVPDISIRNHKKWRTTFEKSISDHLGRGFDGAECVHRYTRRAINNVLDKEPRAETFKRFQVISDIIDSLTNEPNHLPGPIAFAKTEVSRRDLVHLTNLSPGRDYTRLIYRLFPIDNKNADIDREFEIFLIRKDIKMWSSMETTKSREYEGGGGGGGSYKDSASVAGPSSSNFVLLPSKRQLDHGGSSHYSPPPRRRPLPPRSWTPTEETERLNRLLLSGSISVPSGPAASTTSTAGPSNTVVAVPQSNASLHSSTTNGGLFAEREITAPLFSSLDKGKGKETEMDSETEKMDKMLERFTKSIAEQQKDNLALKVRISELEAEVKEREDELTALKATTDGEKMEKLLEDKKSLARDMNKFQLDKARFTAQVSTWSERLGQIQQGLSQYLPRPVKFEDDLEEGQLI